MKEDDSRVAIIQLGGKGVVGNNMILIEYQEQILILDAGIMFPTDEMPGVDLVIPDISYLIKKQDKIKGLLVSHGHEDHIGAIPYLLAELDQEIPIYGTKFTLAFIKKKLDDKKELLSQTDLITVQPRNKIKIDSFTVEFIRVNHSIPDAVAIAISTTAGTVLYTGDFRIEQAPIDQQKTDFYKLAQLGEEGLLALLSDSTNAEYKGYTAPEKIIGQTFTEEFQKTQNRVLVATFSSHIHRVQQVIEAAKNSKRLLAISGRSMFKSIEIAKDLGYLELPSEMIIELEEIDNFAPHKIAVLMTGSQGEPMAALTRAAQGEHSQLEIKATDTIFLSATPIPGNELAVSKTINQLLAKGATVIHGQEKKVHTSGHAQQEELKLMLNLTKPKYFLPVHGEYRHLHQHAQLAKEVGIAKKNIFITPNGVKLELAEHEAKVTDKVSAGKVLIDGSKIENIKESTLQSRQKLADKGILIINLVINDDQDKLIAGPDIISKGFKDLKNSAQLLKQIKSKVTAISKKHIQKEKINYSKLKSEIENTISNYLYRELKRKPIILSLITPIS
ncbi:ribonuclease J [Fuchsiella alkaliacetigena]|uniref:ribonuclease J n=1 Tax=Fuchsiella alkaliacetigena TaxID=957042 RepID=UPI00200AC1C7|nr:ribonuclease J [Fuchsiella alkaliacetigena]MCK8825955.1 ribonuclease J [Fuchsiella alkaliacetigena]